MRVIQTARRMTYRLSRLSPANAGVRTVAHGFEPWVSRSRVFSEPVLTGERKLSFARSKRAHTVTRVEFPTAQSRGLRFLRRLRRRTVALHPFCHKVHA